LCEVLASQARTAPHRLAAEFLEPLKVLLGSENEPLRRAAAKALVGFPGSAGTDELRAIAAKVNESLPTRLAAIDALSSKVDRREVVDTLVSLLKADIPAMNDRVMAALRPLTIENFDRDIERWQVWWREKSKLGIEAWLVDQLQIYRDRLRRMQDEFETYRIGAMGRHEALASRVGAFQRDLFRVLGQDEQSNRLVEWLSDSVEDVNRTALSLVRARIADEGLRPAGRVQDALLVLLRDGSPGIRREVLLIVQTLDEPSVIDGVLAQLEREEALEVRLDILKAIGRLNDPKSLGALVSEIAAPDSDLNCAREAAVALGQIATGVSDHDVLGDAIVAVKQRYSKVDPEDVAFRAALLAAMAGIADPQFAPELLLAVESDHADIVRPSIRGLQAIGERTKTARLRTLTAHADPLVRQAAVEGIGKLGGEDADTESLLTRLNPTIEPSVRVRDAAWIAFRTLLSAKPVAEQIVSVSRLRETPELEIEYLIGLTDNLNPSNGQVAELDEAYHSLGSLLSDAGRYPEAARYFRSLYELRTTSSKGNREAAGLRWLDAVLHDPAAPQVAEVVERLAKSLGNESKSKIVDTVKAYIDSRDPTANADRIENLQNDLQSVPPELLGERWVSLLERLADHSASRKGPPNDEHSP
ncbi:MAG: HEAT repeat domain-containing protein, partial [Planctomycetes bacterium]|nr:HEAT repeat domain-containing protein [Planctomycetota bacterium]